MANYATLKSAISAAIKQNGNNEITGALLQQQLLAMVNSLGAGFQYGGVATPTLNPGTPDINVFWFATGGQYPNMGGVSVDDGDIAVITWNGSWSKVSIGAALKSRIDGMGKIVNYIDVQTGYTYNDSVGSKISYSGRSCTEKVPYIPSNVVTNFFFPRSYGHEALFWSGDTYLGYSHNSVEVVENWIATDRTLPITHIAFCWTSELSLKFYYAPKLLTEWNRIVFAEDYGFSKNNSGSQNATILNNLLSGGNKTVMIMTPGTYDIADTILVESYTELICGKGVTLRKSNNFVNFIRNKGAETRQVNQHIILRGVYLSVNGKTAMHTKSSSLYGLRGELAFLGVRNLVIDDYRVTNLEDANYGIMLNYCVNVRITNFKIAGKKDAIHISKTQQFYIANGEVSTKDDAIALNACDWISSNCVCGSISQGLIENVMDLPYNNQTGYFSRFLVGAWVSWSMGMTIKRGDTVLNNGRLYRAITEVSTGEDFVSQTEPTIETFSGVQQDSGGFEWKLMDDSATLRASIQDVHFRNITVMSNRATFAEEVDTSGEWNRSLYPTVPVDGYPTIEVVAENISLQDSARYSDSFVPTRYANSFMTMMALRGSTREMLLYTPEKQGLRSVLNMTRCDFRGVFDSLIVNAQTGTIVRLRDNSFGNVKSVQAGSVVSDDDIILESATSPQPGDHIIDNGQYKIFNGTNWVVIA